MQQYKPGSHGNRPEIATIRKNAYAGYGIRTRELLRDRILSNKNDQYDSYGSIDIDYRSEQMILSEQNMKGL